MSLYKVTLGRNISQEVVYEVEAEDEDTAINNAWDMCKDDINSGYVVEEHVEEVCSGSNPAKLIE